jgi:hypothetical protein
MPKFLIDIPVAIIFYLVFMIGFWPSSANLFFAVIEDKIIWINDICLVFLVKIIEYFENIPTENLIVSVN